MPPGRKVIPYYKRDRLKSFTYSALLHLAILLLAIVGLPNFMLSPPPEEPMAISVDVLPVSAMSNVRPSRHEPEKKKAEEHKVKPKEAPPVQVAEDEPPPRQEPSILPKPKPKPKPEQKKEKPRPKHHQEDLAAVLRAVQQTAEKEKKEEEPQADDANKSKSEHYNPELPMSLSEIDAIRNQVAKCWNVPAGAKDAQNLVVVLRLQLASDGSVLKVELARDQSRYESDSFFRAAVDSARRAVEECSPLKNLPPEKYATWRDMEMTFDPKEMLF